MFHRVKIVGALLAAGMLLLTACGPKATQTPTPDPNALMTAAVQTVQVELTRSAALTPSVTPTATEAPTATPEPTAEATTAPTADLAAGTAAATATVSAPANPEKPDKATWVSQDPTDNEKVLPGQTFTMLWRVKNTGTTTWTEKYLLRFFAGNAMGASQVVAFPKQVKPNEEVELSVKMTAPSTAGNVVSWWKLTNADGINFYDVSVSIEVTGAPAPSATNTTAPAPTAAPTAASTSTTP